MKRLRARLHTLRYVNCAMCGAEFRKGQGSGLSGRTFCDSECYSLAWAEFCNPGSSGWRVKAKQDKRLV